ncbi:MAG: hypothetical protein MJK10_03895 [Pseudomonadales bacterium]|nr:hypothetical protein [Pseudomonadales bacterium]NRA15214.1 hypothetical protein [Oceanospirillaceae bacterium]
MKQRIQRLIDIYCTFMFSVDRDAGWHTPSQLEATQYISNSGSDLLRKKKFAARFCAADLRQYNDSPDEKMINEMQFIRNKHYDFGLAKMLIFKLEDKQLSALLAASYLTYVYKRGHTDQEVAEYLLIETRAYRHNKKRAWGIIEDQLNFRDELEQLKIA